MRIALIWLWQCSSASKRSSSLTKMTLVIVVCVLLSFFIQLHWLWQHNYKFDLRNQYSDGEVNRPQDDSSGGIEENGNDARRRLRRIKQHLNGDVQRMQIILESARGHVQLQVDGILLINSSKVGLHVFVLNQATGSLMGQRLFSSWPSSSSGNQLSEYMHSMTPGRLVLCALSVGRQLQFAPRKSKEATSSLFAMGSQFAGILSVSDTWAFAAFAKVGRLEELRAHDEPARLKLDITLTSEEEPLCPAWPESEETVRRRLFCRRAEGYSNVCSCGHPAPISFHSQSSFTNFFDATPIVVLGKNRPHYLFRTLTSLLGCKGAVRDLITVEQVGFFEEPRQVAALFNVRSVQHRPLSRSDGDMVFANNDITVDPHHFRLALASAFQRHPTAKNVLVLQDDLEFSIDFFDFLNRTIPLLEADSNHLFCINAWNEHGFEHTSRNSSLLYRVDHMSMKGAWLLSHMFWKQELSAYWPESSTEALRWLQSSALRKKRACLVPDVSRVFIFGETSTSFDFHQHQRVFNQDTSARLADLSYIRNQTNYNEWIISRIGKAWILNTRWKLCDRLALKQYHKRVLALVFNAGSETEISQVWPSLAKCFQLSLTPSCFHAGICIFSYFDNQVMLIATPLTPVNLRSQLPNGITSLLLKRQSHNFV